MAFRKQDYHPKWSLIRRLVLRRAGGVCEGCGVRDGAIVKRIRNRSETVSYRYATGCERLLVGVLRVVHRWPYWKSLKYYGLTRISTAVAHLDRNRANNRFGNLRALCQRCHLLHDLPQHVRNRKFGRYHDRDYQQKVFVD